MIFGQEDTPQENSENDIAVVSYRVDKDGEFYVDINLEDYSEKTIQQLGYLISSIPTTPFQIQTMEMVKQAFIRDGKADELEKLLTMIILKSEKLLEHLEKQRDEDEESTGNEPCIEPSDML